MMTSKRNIVLSTTALCVAVAASTIAFAGSHGGEKAQEAAAKYRQSTFSMVKHHFGPMGAMMKGKVAFNAEAFAKNAAAVATLSQLAPNGFEVSGVSMESDAKDAIWENKAAFDEKMTAFQTASAALAEAAKSGDEGKMKKAFGPVAKSCKGCHTDYREKN